MLHQGLELDPCLQAISDFLDNNASMIDAVRRDLIRGLKNPHTGRHGLTPQQVLRSLILKRVKNWDYRELRDRIADGYSLRKFTEFYSQPVPKYHAFNQTFNRLTPKTLKIVNDLVVKAAVDLGRRHHGGADQHSSSHGQYLIMGCGPRCDPHGRSAG